MSDTPQEDTFAALAEELEEITDDISDVKLFDIPVLIVFVLLFTTVALQFITRYVFNDSLGWTEEIARYFLILLGFVGSVTCVRKGKHIFLEFAYHYLPHKSLKPIRILVEAIVAGFWGYAGWLAIVLSQKTKSNMASIEIPKAYVYYFVVASCFAMALFAVMNLVRCIRKSTEAHTHDWLQQTHPQTDPQTDPQAPQTHPQAPQTHPQTPQAQGDK